MNTFAKKQIESPSFYQGIMLLLWKYQSNWRGILTFDKKLSRSFWPLLISFIYWITLYTIAGLTTLNVITVSIALGLYYYNRATQKFIRYYFPLVLSTLLFDSMRLYATFFEHNLHLVGPYAFEKFLFGMNIDGTLLTPNEFLATRTNTFFDFTFGLTYLLIIPGYIFLSLFLYGANLSLWVKKMNWSWLIVSLCALITYHLYNVTPPWLSTLKTIDVDMASSAAGLLRFDQLIGINVFQSLHENANIFMGSLPALHIAYPFIALFIAFQIGRFRILCALWALLASFAAIYFNLHYVSDVLLAIIFACISVVIMEQVSKPKKLS